MRYTLAPARWRRQPLESDVTVNRTSEGARRRPGRLADRLCPRPRILFVGINPSLRSAEVGHHFAGPGNPFWRLLAAAGLVPTPLDYTDDVRLPAFGLALTNI